MRERWFVPLAAALALGFAAEARAITDEIQVYTDELDAKSERGLELHVNTTPRGRKTPDYPGDQPPYRGWRVTPEWSWGLGNDLESGLYLPTATSADGTFYLAGIKPRLKWLPVRPGEGRAGWYFGANGELDYLSSVYAQSRWSSELRLIGGYHARRWLIGANVIPEWNFSSGYRGSPDLNYAFKAIHDLVPGLALGAEYYAQLGTLAHRLPWAEQPRTLYLVAEVERRRWSVNFGIGHGLTPASDNWTVKAIFGFSFE